MEHLHPLSSSLILQIQKGMEDGQWLKWKNLFNGLSKYFQDSITYWSLGFHFEIMNISCLCFHHWCLVTNCGATGNSSVNISKKIDPKDIYVFILPFPRLSMVLCKECHKCPLNKRMRNRKEGGRNKKK